jgi:hypothetical protein
MKLLLTSFGISDREKSDVDDSIFRYMPPVSTTCVKNRFLPDYPSLLLADKLVVDENSFDFLTNRPHWSYSMVSEAFKVLKEEGFIELANFNEHLASNALLLDKMLDHDLKILEEWVEPFNKSLDIWQRFSNLTCAELDQSDCIPKLERQNFNVIIPLRLANVMRTEKSDSNTADLIKKEMKAIIKKGQKTMKDDIFSGSLRSLLVGRQGLRFLEDYYSRDQLTKIADESHGFSGKTRTIEYVREALKSSKKRKTKEYRSALREALRGYLGYVNSNIVLSHEFCTAFHDWADFLPFYNRKFLNVGKKPEKATEMAESRKLFEVSFPDLAIHDVKSFMKIVTDKRIGDLRSLIADAASGKVEFDEEFSRETLREVLGEYRRTKRMRRYVSYMTMPIGFIPWIGTPLQKLIEEGISKQLEIKLEKKHRWHYMLSEIT